MAIGSKGAETSPHENRSVGGETRSVFSSRFTEAESAYRDMIADGILVGDRWFPKTSSAAERAEYLAKYCHREERNRRRRERRHATSAPKPHPPRRSIPDDPESQCANRMPLERRKCVRRSTIAECPTPDDLRTAWRFRNDSREAYIRLGGMLLDLDCYVDNSLITIMVHNKAKIVGRKAGLRGWISENCPELEGNYKTLQNIKGIVKRLRQSVGVIDPVPVSVLMDPSISEQELSDVKVHVQPRDGGVDQVRNRFVWEESPLLSDLDGRKYFHNENYWLINFRTTRATTSDGLDTIRKNFRLAIIPDGKENRTIGNYSKTAKNGVRRDGAGGCGMACGQTGDGGICAGFRDMIRDFNENPGLMVDVGKDMIKNLTRELKEGLLQPMLPSRTLARMRRGERTSVVRFLLDALDGYMDFYSFFLICRHARYGRDDDLW